MKKTNVKSVKKTATKKTATNKPVKSVKKPVKPVSKVKATNNKTATKKPVKKPVKSVEKDFDVKEYEKRKAFLQEYGFETVSDFSKAIGDDIANTTKVLQGKQKPNVEKMIKYAIFLDAGLGDIINLFYPEQMQEYKKKHNKKRK